MVKRQRRMTKKKSAKKPSLKRQRKAPANSSKGKKVTAPKGRTPAKPDRATQAVNKLLKSLQKKRSQQ